MQMAVVSTGVVLDMRSLCNVRLCGVQGCFVKPSKLAELQMEAALNRNIGDLYFPSSPISGGSSDSTFH